MAVVFVFISFCLFILFVVVEHIDFLDSVFQFSFRFNSLYSSHMCFDAYCYSFVWFRFLIQAYRKLELEELFSC